MMIKQHTMGKGLRRWMGMGLAALGMVANAVSAPAPARAQSGEQSGVKFYYPDLNLGPAEIGRAYQEAAYLVNWENFPVSYTVAGTTGPFKTPDKGAQGTLPARTYITLMVSFVPQAEGPASGQLYVTTNYLLSAVVILPLAGKGVDRDKLPDLSGIWRQGSLLPWKLTHAPDDRASLTYRYQDLWYRGRFDGEWWYGYVYLSNGNVLTYFAFRLVAPDLLEGREYTLDGRPAEYWVLTRRAPYAGQWRTAMGIMTIQRITEEQAKTHSDYARLTPAFTLNPSRSWYLGTYPWSGGGQILGLAANTYDAEKLSNLFGCYREVAGTKSGHIYAQPKSRSDIGELTRFEGQYVPDTVAGIYPWWGDYSAPPP